MRPVDNGMSLESVDIFDLFITTPYDDAGIRRSNSTQGGNGNGGGGESCSLWESLCGYICSLNTTLPVGKVGSLGAVSRLIIQRCRPAPTNTLLQYLSITSQHSVIGRVSSVLLWGSECVGKGKGITDANSYSETAQKRVRIETLAATVVHGRLRSSIALASFLGVFNQILSCNFSNTDSGAFNDNRDIRLDFLSKELYRCLEDLIIAITSPSSHSAADLVDLDESIEVSSSEDFHVLLNSMLYERADGNEMLNSSILCLCDRLRVMYKSSKAFSAVIVERNNNERYSELDASIRCCCTSPELFLHLHRIAYLADIVELTKRIRDVTVRPTTIDSEEQNYGAALAIRANYALADAVDDMFSALLPADESLLSEGLAVRLHLSAEQVICWSRVFEHAVEQLSFDEALAAVVRLVALDNSHEPGLAIQVKKILDSFGASDWRTALSSLVMHVCVTGRLGWLCSLDDIWVRGTHISGLIAEELAKLASSGYSSMDGINSPSYYECSCVYALSRQNLQEAARMSVVHVQTIDSQQQALGQVGPLSDTSQIR